jgi:ATP-dependent DNA helicase RecG
MDWPEVQDRIQRGEDAETELKRWDSFPRGVGEALCAFANTTGGLLVLGVGDDGRVVGVAEDPDAVQEKLTSFLHTGLSAPLRASLGRHETEAGFVHWLAVRRSHGAEPLRYRGRVLVRRGRASTEASGAELQDLFNRFGFVLTEEQVVPGSTSADLDPAAFRSFLVDQGLDVDEEPQPDPTLDLRNRGALDDDAGVLRATLYGLLCFGKDPQRFAATANAFIDCVAYRGGDRASEAVLTGRAAGRADEQVERALGWVAALGQHESYDDLRRSETPLLPKRVLREALVNAVAHRDYAILGSKVLFEVFADHVVVTSPGELPNHLSVAAVLAGGAIRSRNERIAHFLLVRRLMEKRGRGLPVIRREMRAFNGTEPELCEDRDARFVRLTLRRRA